MKEMAYLFPCTMTVGAQGKEARCTLEPPFDALMFGCGPDLEHPAERLRLTLADGHQAEAFRGALEGAFGVCPGIREARAGANSDTACGDEANKDEACAESRRCYLPRGVHGSSLASGPRPFAEGRTAFPMGLFMEQEVAGGGAGAQTSSATPKSVGETTASGVGAVALVMETELLTANERTAVVQQVETILSLYLEAE